MEPSLAAGFGMFTGHQSSFYAEFMADIFAIEQAWAPKKKKIHSFRLNAIIIEREREFHSPAT